MNWQLVVIEQRPDCNHFFMFCGKELKRELRDMPIDVINNEVSQAMDWITKGGYSGTLTCYPMSGRFTTEVI